MSEDTFDLHGLFTPTDDYFGHAEDIGLWSALPPVPNIAVNGTQTDQGTNPVVQTFFEGPEKCECCINWVEKQPMEIPETDKDRYQQAAICLYRRKDHEKKNARMGGLIAMKDDRLVLQSQRLIDLVRPDLTKSGVLLPAKGEVEFLAPFKELYFSYSRIYEHKERLTADSEDWIYMALLVDVMCSLLSDTTSTVSKLLSKSSIDYDHLWTIFPKYAVVYWKRHDQDMLAQITDVYIDCCHHKTTLIGIHHKDRTERTELGLRIRYQYIAFDGVNFGLIEGSKLIPRFGGDRLITSFDLYPVEFHSQPDIISQLRERGARVLDLQDMVHCEYEGIAIDALNQSSVYVTGRVIVDVFRFSIVNPDDIIYTDPIEDKLVKGLFTQGSDIAYPMQDSAARAQRDQSSKDLPRISYGLDRRPTTTEQQANKEYFFAHRHLLTLVDAFVHGFSLKHNKWLKLNVLKLRDITWTPRPLDRLIFNESIKNMLSSFARHHATSLPRDSSMLAAKGSGLAILLSGPPGTGKTLTAEVVAEEARLPLYRVLAGELGSSPSAIECALTEILDLATRWQCVVLLDEVDTFIANRDSSDRISSEIVSIFLRQMEYYRGIIFLTTNLPRNIDSAFRSRCRLHIQYQPLGQTSRVEVWRLNFHRAGLSDKSRLASTGRPIGLVLTDAQLETISAWELSGRDIHNVVQNVVLWSIAEGSDVTFERLNTSVKLTVPYASKTSFEPAEYEASGLLVQPNVSSLTSGQSSRKRARSGLGDGGGSDAESDNPSRKEGRLM